MATKNISAGQSKRFSKCVLELEKETFDSNNAAFVKPFLVFEMKITQSQNNYFSVAPSSCQATFALRNILCFIELLPLAQQVLNDTYSNIEKHGINGYLGKGLQILCFVPLQSCMFTLIFAKKSKQLNTCTFCT